MKLLINKEVHIERTLRTEILESMFDVPATDKLSINISGDLPVETRDWSIGLIVGPSGSGKTLTLTEMFGEPLKFEWSARSVVDDFDKALSMEAIASVCSSVGFNTIPSWLRPYSVLSNGERFRVEVARRLLSNPQHENVLNKAIIIDEFTSVVDRQVAQITSHAVQKYVRSNERQLVAASCHYDIIDWLQPDWIYDTGLQEFQWRSLCQRPPITVSIQRVPYQTWNIFSKYHYMTNEQNKAARCYGLFVSKRPVVLPQTTRV